MDPLPLTLFKNGLLIREGPFRPFTKPDAKAFMKDLQDGYFPYELKYAFPEGVPFSVDDRREEEYTTEKVRADRKICCLLLAAGSLPLATCGLVVYSGPIGAPLELKHLSSTIVPNHE